MFKGVIKIRTYLKGKLRSGRLIRRKELVQEIADLTNLNEKDVAKVIEVYGDVVMQHISMEDHMNLGFGIVGGKTALPVRKTRSYQTNVPNLTDSEKGYTNAKTGVPYIAWNDELRRGKKIHPSVIYIENVPMKYTTKAYWYRVECGYPEIPEYEGLPESRILELCAKADEIVFGKMSQKRMREMVYQEKDKAVRTETKWISLILEDLQRQRERGVSEDDLVIRDPNVIYNERQKEIQDARKMWAYIHATDDNDNTTLELMKEYKDTFYRPEFLTPEKRKELEATKDYIMKKIEYYKQKAIENGDDVEYTHFLNLLKKEEENDSDGQVEILMPDKAVEKFENVNRYLNNLSKMNGKDNGSGLTIESEYHLLQKKLEKNLEQLEDAKEKKDNKDKGKNPWVHGGKKILRKKGETKKSKKEEKYRKGLEKALMEGKTKAQYDEELRKLTEQRLKQAAEGKRKSLEKKRENPEEAYLNSSKATVGELLDSAFNGSEILVSGKSISKTEYKKDYVKKSVGLSDRADNILAEILEDMGEKELIEKDLEKKKEARKQQEIAKRKSQAKKAKRAKTTRKSTK